MKQASLFQEHDTRPQETPADIYSEILEKAAVLYPGRTFIFGTGNENARVIFVGESPGPPDDIEGKPFSGPAGELLFKMIASIGLAKADCYFTNIVKFMSQGDEITSATLQFFTPYLVREIAAVGPELVVSMGNSPTRSLLGTKKPISQLRGEFHEAAGFPMFATFNPAYLLRDPTKKRESWEDMKMIREFLK